MRFSVNGGPEYSSESLNFTHRSLAIRSRAPVKVGDAIEAAIDCLAPLQGEVVRVWDEGFAISLSASSLGLVTIARAAEPVETNGAVPHDQTDDRGRVTSFVFPLACADAPAWARLASAPSRSGRGERHRLSIMTPGSIDVDAIGSVWISIEETRWVARLAGAGQRNGNVVLAILLNGWQMHMAARHGMTVTVVFNTLGEWKVRCHAEAFERHLAEFAPEIGVLSA
ncbi:MAG: hypothetical protein ACE5FO_11795 [Parvularculaceae bacterium]